MRHAGTNDSSGSVAVPSVGVPSVVLVAVGGAVGVLLRHLLGLGLADWGTDIAMVVANLTGSLALGFLAARLVREPTGSTRSLTLSTGLGPGLLGGYTTYSGLAIATVTSAQDVGVAYATVLLVATLCGGLLACLLGLRLGAGSGGR